MGNHMTGATTPGGVFLQLVPVLIGAFAGAPVLARELETGTFRYAWTQGFGRGRWALAKLVLLAVVLAAATGACGVLVSWYYQPYFAAGNQALGLYQISPFATLFSLRGVAFPAWTLAAFVIGALAGMLIRRVVPAIVATLAVYAGLAVAADGFLREHYLTPLVTTSPNVPGTAWIISQWWTKDGRFAFASPPLNLINQFCNFPPPGQGKPSAGTFAQCLAQHGYTQWTSYQPASRFWPFQWIEGGWLLALSALLIAATIWLVRRRAA
jgi:ABC-type transport system involved in multi-copper enzyme maturation permease subunit